MKTKEQILCDTCRKNLTECGSMPKFRLHIECEKIPSNSLLQKAVRLNPPLNDDLYFCDMECIRKYFGGGLVQQEFGTIEKGANIVGIKIDKFG